ncbi:hypothetical protein GF345_05185 [Candidatus Woesearchaeota archaeon]|nr:hypothetical protein [Candidatus Woesearchaeota archaeon]
MVGLIFFVSVATIAYWYLADSDRSSAEQLLMDPAVAGTSIEPGVQTVQKMLERGRKTVPIQQVVEEKDGYVCAITTTQYGPMSLKVKNGMIRQDIQWGSGTATAYILEQKVYRYSSQYGEWLVFDYDPQAEISVKQMTRGILSEFELLNKTVPENTLCVEAEVQESEFEFPADKAVDIMSLLNQVIQ